MSCICRSFGYDLKLASLVPDFFKIGDLVAFSIAKMRLGQYVDSGACRAV